MMLVHGPILAILSLLLGLLSTPANAAPLIRSINPIVPRALLHSHLQLRSQESQNIPPPTLPPTHPPFPHADGHSKRGTGATPMTFYDVWFSKTKPEPPARDPIVPSSIQHETYKRIMQLEHSEGPLGLVFLEPYLKSESKFWYQESDQKKSQSHQVDFVTPTERVTQV
ncbi:hypothetical protein GGU10DRAFT_116015 [Lentinula aff. detonsa]|uniref:Uncharacterized protein n=1 Tax=Lentinula aff. detonsa TaxID=2804958 RepID=A0AA38KX14_9AGAR|nr:hypothetical protein GGU10DRAFT_116015 [Lentinula aff. detonsa]